MITLKKEICCRRWDRICSKIGLAAIDVGSWESFDASQKFGLQINMCLVQDRKARAVADEIKNSF